MTYPRTCYVCGKPVAKTESVAFHYDHATKTATTRHTDCKP